MAANLRSRGLGSLGKRLVGQIQSPDSVVIAPLTLSLFHRCSNIMQVVLGFLTQAMIQIRWKLVPELNYPSVATFLYGAAHHNRRSLDSIRRELGYFKPNADGNQWVGGPQPGTLRLNPDEGPRHVVPEKGVIVIGATDWVDNYNVRVFTSDMDAVHKIARRVSGRGGGLPSVQSMALAHGKDIIEVACNLLDTSNVGGDQVQREVEWHAREEGMDVGEGYYTDLSQGKLIENYLKLADHSTH